MYFFQSADFQHMHLSIYDIVLAPFFIGLVILFAYHYKRKKEQVDPLYRFFHWAIAVKLLAVTCFSIIYMTFYAGDTAAYFDGAAAMTNLLFSDPGGFLNLMLEGNKPEYYIFFTPETGYPEYYMFVNSQTFFVIRFFTPFAILGGKSYLMASLMVSLLSFVGMWKFYKLLCELYPGLYKYFFVSIHIIPSVIFWGSGILKDTITLSATAWITYSIFQVFFMRKKIIVNVVAIIILSYLIINVKPYIFVSLIPGLLIWVFFNQVQKIKNKLIRMLTIPIVILMVLFSSAFLLSYFSNFLGTYGNVDTMIAKVKLTQEDLLRSEAYGSNNYDIGVIEPTPFGLVKKAPAAIIAGLFRPFIWEARNPFVLISGLENLSILLIFFFVLIKIGPPTFVRAVIKDPFLTYAWAFAILFAFGIGLASANFGALVRYRIPLMPFLLSGLFILLEHWRKIKQQRELDRL
jgi:hypothetical protein